MRFGCETAAAASLRHQPADLRGLLADASLPPPPRDGLDQPSQRALADRDLLDVRDARAAVHGLDVEPCVERLGEPELLRDVDAVRRVPPVPVDDGARKPPHELAVLPRHHPVGLFGSGWF